jgi:hypothetical protein
MRTSAAALLAAAASTAPAPAAAPPVVEEPLSKLVARLGHDDPDARDSASASLLRRDDAIPALRAASRHEDAEIRRRARRLLAQVQDRIIAARFATGDWEDAVSILLRGGSQDDDLGLRELCKFAARLRDDALREKPKMVSRWWAVEDALDFETLAARHARRRHFSAGKLVWSCKHPQYGSSTSGIGRAGELHSSVDWVRSLVVVGGETRQEPNCKITGCLVASSGSVQLGFVSHSLILCDGSVTVTGLQESLVIARGDVSLQVPSSNVIICGGKIVDTRDESRKIAKDAASHKLVRFFELARVGVEVEPSDAGVKVKAAPHGGCFSRGGVRAGDVVVAIAGERVADAEALRRLILPHAAEQASVAVTLLRDGKRVVANVPLRP